MFCNAVCSWITVGMLVLALLDGRELYLEGKMSEVWLDTAITSSTNGHGHMEKTLP